MTDQPRAMHESAQAATALTVLVVDDSATTRRLVRLVLEQRGHAVVEADTADAAVAAAERHAPDVIVLDLDLASTRSGAAIAPILKSVGHDARILVYSGYLDSEVEWVGVDGVLSKQEPLATLVERVEDLGDATSAVAT